MLLEYFKTKEKISLRRKKFPKKHLIIFKVYFDNNKIYLRTTAADYVLKHTDTQDNQE